MDSFQLNFISSSGNWTYSGHLEQIFLGKGKANIYQPDTVRCLKGKQSSVGLHLILIHCLLLADSPTKADRGSVDVSPFPARSLFQKQKGIWLIVGQPSADNLPAPIIADMFHTNICSPPNLVHRPSTGLIVTEALISKEPWLNWKSNLCPSTCSVRACYNKNWLHSVMYHLFNKLQRHSGFANILVLETHIF